jgi:hypothetical protein
MPTVSDPLDRIAIALRLWAGCLAAAKTIADATRSGIDATAANDGLFRAGVEAARMFKRLRGQPFFLDGVPERSAVRRYT